MKKSEEYAVNVRREHSDQFVRQEEVFATYEEAKAFTGEHEPEDGHYHEIVRIDYDENGEETCWDWV